MDVEVYWDGRLVGHLRDMAIDQPYYHGAWVPFGDAGFEQAYRSVQSRVASGGRGMLPVTFRSPDGATSAPAALMVRPDTAEPYFRFGGGGSAPVATPDPSAG